MKYIGIALIYVSFFALIGFCVWFCESLWPLLGLIALPSFSEKTTTNEN
jgi:hypothetical protein